MQVLTAATTLALSLPRTDEVISDALVSAVPSVEDVLCNPPCVGLHTYEWTELLLEQHGIAINASLMRLLDMPGLSTGLRDINRGYDNHLRLANTSVDVAGERLPVLRRWPTELQHVVSHILHARTFALFPKFLAAELHWAHPTKQLRQADTGADKQLVRQPSWVFGALLLLYGFFDAIGAPEIAASRIPHPPQTWNTSDLAVSAERLRRVEDNPTNTWGLQFEEADQACGPLHSEGHNRYSIAACGPRLLRAGSTLTPRSMLTFSDLMGIWNWRSAQSNGHLRWELLPPHGHSHVLRARPAKPNSAKWARMSRTDPAVPRDYDPATYVNELSGFESMLLPGERFRVQSVTWNDTAAHGYTTVYLRQEECFHGGMQ